MAEDLEDINEDEAESKGKSKKKPAKEKKAEPEAQPAAAGGKAGKKAGGEGAKGKSPKGKDPFGKKKKGGKFLLIIIIVLVLLVLIAAFCTVVYFNWWGLGEKVLNPISDWLVGVVVWLNPEFRSIDQELRAANDERNKVLDSLDEEIKQRVTEVEAREAAASTREVQLDRRSAALDKQEEQQTTQQLAAILPAFQRELTEQELTDMQSLSRVYASMQPEAAATVLVELFRPEDIATIIYFMSERNSAAILANLDPKIAALITEYLLDPVFAADKYEKMQNEYDNIKDSAVNDPEETTEPEAEEEDGEP